MYLTTLNIVLQVKFPGLIGPLNERLICKIKCIDGNWVGPLCSNTPGQYYLFSTYLIITMDNLLGISIKYDTFSKLIT